MPHQANDDFAARFYLDRLLSLPRSRTTARFRSATPCRPTRSSSPARASATPRWRRRPTTAAPWRCWPSTAIVWRSVWWPRRTHCATASPDRRSRCCSGVWRRTGHQPAGRGVVAGAGVSRPEATRRGEAVLPGRGRSGSTGRATPRTTSGSGSHPTATRAATRSTGKRGTSATCSGRRSNGGWR